MRNVALVVATLVIGQIGAWSQAPAPPKPPAEPAKAAAEKPAAPTPEEKPTVVSAEWKTSSGKTLKYKATTGYLTIKNESTGDNEAQMFYVGYTLDAAPVGQRPLTVCFNGGPGAGTVWLHMGAIGPKRVKMLDDGSMPPPPYQFVDNEGTWLEKSDLLFIDAIGTGYSRAKNPEIGKKFYGLSGDIAAFGQAIRRYLDINKRWTSPLFLAGESYGTTRASGLSNYLFEHGIGLNGIMLISTIMNFQTARFARANDLPYSLFLPTYTAIAWYHKKLPAPELQADLQKALAESRQFAMNEYPSILQKGDLLSETDRKSTVAKLHRLTGLSEEYLEQSDLRVEIQRFCRELLRSENKTVGRLDGRLTGVENGTGERPEFDPSLTAIRTPYTAVMNQYVREVLNWDTDREYFSLGGGITSPWDFDLARTPGGQGYADTSEALRSAMAKNPYMKVMIAKGYYDLATPFHAVEYTVAHMQLEPSLRKNIVFTEYEAGHMMYIHVPSLKKLRADTEKFIDGAIAH